MHTGLELPLSINLGNQKDKLKFSLYKFENIQVLKLAKHYFTEENFGDLMWEVLSIPSNVFRKLEIQTALFTQEHLKQLVSTLTSIK